MKQKIILSFLFLGGLLKSNAQCAMCRAVLESEESQSAAEGINDGILFLMIVPYLLVGTIGYFVYKTYSKSKKTKNTEDSM
ncbi:hypothetical protein [Winogradskyella sp.]|uniref:hypothetical protein n=1 Tax=Winogradskyella sp. TaxID=1883156 RepID=UPI003F6A8C47